MVTLETSKLKNVPDLARSLGRSLAIHRRPEIVAEKVTIKLLIYNDEFSH